MFKRVLALFCLLAISFITVASGQKPTSDMLGLRTVIYEVENMEAAVKWYSKAFSTAPYFNTPEYVGFNIRGYELGLMPTHKDSLKGNNVLSYWGVEDIEAKHAKLLELGAKPNTPIIPVGGGIKLATVTDPFGNVVGLIYNPTFKLE